jgi:16S rRNA (cytosine967-C5)-methyltransferase
MKWRLNQNQVNWYSSVQKDILKNTLNLLKKNGVLVFSTCSIFPEEGEQVINAVREKVTILKPEIPGSEGHKGYIFSPKIKRFFPHKHGTQGFFICKMKLE